MRIYVREHGEVDGRLHKPLCLESNGERDAYGTKTKNKYMPLLQRTTLSLRGLSGRCRRTHRLQIGLVHLRTAEGSPFPLAGRLVVQAGVDAALAAADNFGLDTYNLMNGTRCGERYSRRCTRGGLKNNWGRGDVEKAVYLYERSSVREDLCLTTRMKRLRLSRDAPD